MTKALELADKANTVRKLFADLRKPLSAALPKHMADDTNRLLRIALNTIQKKPELLNCTQESLCNCVLEASQLGLDLDGVLGHAYLMPFGRTATLIPGYKGLMKLARQSGEIKTVEARIVRKGDEFNYCYGLNPDVTHVPGDNDDPVDLIFVYAIARLVNGECQFEVMSRTQVDRIRSRSKAKDNGPWVTDYEEMAKKTVIRRLCKMLPASVQLQRAVALVERAEAGIPQEIDLHDIDIEIKESTSPLKSGKTAIVDKPEPVEPPTAEPTSVGPPKEKKGVDLAAYLMKPVYDVVSKIEADDAWYEVTKSKIGKNWTGYASYEEAHRAVEITLAQADDDKQADTSFIGEWRKAAVTILDAQNAEE